MAKVQTIFKCVEELHGNCFFQFVVFEIEDTTCPIYDMLISTSLSPKEKADDSSSNKLALPLSPAGYLT